MRVPLPPLPRLAAIVGLALIGGCQIETGWPGGTGVGNPGSTSVRSRQLRDVTLLSGTARLLSLEVTRCPPDPADRTEIDREIDLLRDGPFEVPGGSWCSVEARFDGPLTYEGVAESGEPGKGTFEAILDVPRITVPIRKSLFVDGGTFLLELGPSGWIGKEDLDGLEDGTHTVVQPGDPAHDRIVASLANGSALFEDLDGDGIVSDAERIDPVGAGASWSGEGDDDDEDDD